jgi:hypothetical protein
MVDVDMEPMPPKIIGKKICSQAKGLLGLLKDPGPKSCRNS